VASSRREFVGTAIVGLSPKAPRPVAGSFVHESQKIGHELRHRACLRTPTQKQKITAVIVGGGIAGLSAAWRLVQRGFQDFVILELEKQAGGNARWGENEVSAYPWAAHYLPLPDTKVTLVRELCQDLGLLKDGRWDELHLCHSPQERLYLHGRWQEGLLPETAATPKDHDQYRRFEERMEKFRATGEFTIPMERGARPSPLDRISMRDWMREQGFDSAYLNWHADYCCRDDYGAAAAATSAWAGIHYFASRHPEDKGPLTWPEGNGWIVKRMLARLGRFVRPDSMAYCIRRDGRRYRVVTETVEYTADFVIFAAPTFLAPYVVEGAPALKTFEYSPWLTANLTLDRWPAERGSEPAWDNVVYGSPTLGYVVATHQSLRTKIDRTVWTFYWALADGPALQRRQFLLGTDWVYWKEAILNDLARAHPDIRDCVSRIDILRLGHAMIRPAVGFLAGEERRRMATPSGNLVYANSDLSGLSLFEEAQYRGVKAADHVLRRAS
jgi:hypothetical protein